jgi:membrane fusion protein, copper/silver efflux system
MRTLPAVSDHEGSSCHPEGSRCHPERSEGSGGRVRRPPLRSLAALGMTRGGAVLPMAALLLLASLFLACGDGEEARAGKQSAWAPAGAKAPAAAGERKVLFYRNPMDPAVTSPVPAKDAMGMDYVPVYADEAPPPATPANTASAVPGLARVEASASALRLAGVQTAVAERRTLARSIRAAGLVTADESRVRHVHTKISGWVERLYVNATGQAVRAGQPLLAIYSPELLATQEEYLRAREAAGRFAGSELPEVRRGGEDLLAAARRRLELLDVPRSLVAQLDRTGRPQRTVTLPAPASGYVTGKNVFEGMEVGPGMDLMTVTDLSRVWVEADFYEYESRLLALGQKVSIQLPYDPGQARTGRVSFIYPFVQPESRTVKVRIELANPGLRLKPGMYADVSPELAAPEGVVIPDSAVIDTGVRQVVFVESGGGFEPRQVRIGSRADGQALIVEGIAAGERVAVRANFLLDSESRLRAAIAGMNGTDPRGGGGR